MKEVNMAQEIQLHDALSSVVADYSTTLSVEQLRAIPLIAQGIPFFRVAKEVGVTTENIKSWYNLDRDFNMAVKQAINIASSWHEQEINKLGAVAVDRLWSIVGSNYESASESEKREIARTARFIIDKIVGQKQQQTITHEISTPELNISENTVDILAKRIHELSLQDDPKVKTEYDIDHIETSFARHPDTDLGKINYDEVENMFQCHICGKWVVNLPDHIDKTHAISVVQYRKAFNLTDDVTESWLREQSKARQQST